MTRPKVLAAALAAVLLLGGCAPGTHTDQEPPPGVGSDPEQEPVGGFREPPPGSGTERYLDQELQWAPCDGQECAEIAVPLDWEDPDGQAITISMLRVPADGEPKGTIFVNPGGPGGSGKDLAAYFSREGLTDYDIIGWDPRGVDDSTPVQCGSTEQMDEFLEVDNSPDDPAEVDALDQAARDYGERCAELSGDLLEHVSTVDTVADLDLLRQLVGDDKLNFLGYSYGTEIGAVYADLHPDKVGRLVLDSAVDISPGRQLSQEIPQAEGFSRVLNDFAEWCVEQECALGNTPDEVTGTVAELLTRLDAEPLTVGDRELTQSLAVNGVMHPMYMNESAWRVLAEAVDRADRGDGSWLLQLADDYNSRGDNGYSSLMNSFNAIRCTSEPQPELEETYQDAEEVAETVEVLGPFMGVDNVCALWPVEVTKPNPDHMTAAGADPIMVIGSRGDSATPFEYSEHMADQLESGFLVTWEGIGHGTYGGTSRCVDQAVVDYFHDDLEATDLTCRE